ncbi:hypothetical protein AWV80_00235 [Cupriavidus sp. UYMU48A]|nr:hypothetical protein AWV80_00235 [Cupriavidus sp. UYMU48A]
MALGFGCDAQGDKPTELVCAGQVKLGEDISTDKFVLRIDGNAIEIRGEPGTAYTFDGTTYRVCSVSRDEIEFAIAGECGSRSNLSRFGDLNKVTGDLTIQRFVMGKPFVGSYKCERASRVLNERSSR